MANIDYYISQAIDARVRAERDPLPQRKFQWVQSAERWEEMARAAEELERQTRVNEEERRIRPYHHSREKKDGACDKPKLQAIK